MNTSKRIALRNSMIDCMDKEGLSDMDMEQMDIDLLYSRGVRALCVFDPIFEYQVDLCIAMFNKDHEKDADVCLETFETLYGDVHVSAETDTDAIWVSLVDPLSENE